MLESIRAAQAAAKSAAESAYSERAWMTPEGVEISLSSSMNVNGVTYPEAIGIAPKWKNTGRSPAVKANIFTTMRWAKFEAIAPNFENLDTQDEGSTIVGPGVIGAGIPQWIFGSDLEKFRSRDLKCFIYTRITYRTVFEPDLPKISELCIGVMFDGMQAGPDGNLVPRLVHIASGNQNTAT